MYRIYTIDTLEPYNFEFNTETDAKQFAIVMLSLTDFIIAK